MVKSMNVENDDYDFRCDLMSDMVYSYLHKYFNQLRVRSKDI